MQDSLRNPPADGDGEQTRQEGQLLQAGGSQVIKRVFLEKKKWISLSRAEYAGYDLEEALAQLKMEMVKIIGEDDGEDGEED